MLLALEESKMIRRLFSVADPRFVDPFEILPDSLDVYEKRLEYPSFTFCLRSVPQEHFQVSFLQLDSFRGKECITPCYHEQP
jgi:hypothetical protein